MCLILLSYQSHPRYKLVVAANRDEFYRRPTQPADFWKDLPQVLAGRDLEAGGTWMGINTHGKISMLTNYRDLTGIKLQAPSRGHLVSDFLLSEENAKEYLARIEEKGGLYNGFNMICGHFDKMFYYGNYGSGIQPITPGYYGLSNALLNTSWPKVDKGLEKLKAVLDEDIVDPASLVDVLYDDIKAPDHLLPDTGVGLEWERKLSSMFIKSPEYGSRCSTVVLVDYKDQVQYMERTYDVTDFTFTDRHYRLDIDFVQ